MFGCLFLGINVNKKEVNKMKLKNIKVILGLLFVSSPAFSTGIPVFDGGNLINNTQQQVQSWLIEAERWTSRLQQYQNDYKSQLDQLATQTGIRNIAGLINQIKSNVDDLTDIDRYLNYPNSILEYGTNILSPRLKAIYRDYGVDQLCNYKYGDSTQNEFDIQKQKRCEGKIIIKTLQYERARKTAIDIKNRISNINSIAERMSRSTDAKETADLNNTMQTQLALLQMTQAKIALQRDLEAQQKEQLDIQEKAEFARRNHTFEWRN